MGQHGRFGAQEVVVITQRERERTSQGFSLMTLLGGVSMEMATLQHSTEAAGGAPMRRWFQERGVIGAGVGTVDNGGALVVPFIGQLGSRRRAVKGWKAAAMSLQ
jgi:hypothetical protein